MTDKITLTAEQSAIIANPPTGTLLIEAGPGCAKSTTLGFLARHLQKQNLKRLTAVAFNKDAALALERKMPTTVTTQTINSYGFNVWLNYIQKTYNQCTINVRKGRQLLQQIADNPQWSIAPDEVDTLLQIFDLCRAKGYIPPTHGKPFTPFEQILFSLNLKAEVHYKPVIDALLKASIQQAFDGHLDFEDQCYMPAFFAPTIAFQPLNCLMVDEAQDISETQLLLLFKAKADYRVFVGDPHQAIYAFRGSLSNAFDAIRTYYPNATLLPLQTSFRIPPSVIPLLRTTNPLLTTVNQVEGMVQIIPYKWSLKSILPVDKTRAILCRNNAPLIKAAFAAIGHNIPFAWSNIDWIRSVVKQLERVSVRHSSIPDALERLQEIYTDRDDVADRIDALTSLATLTEARNVKSLINNLNNLCFQTSKQSTAVLLSTAHKAKGLEFDWVLHLDSHLIPSKHATTSDQLQQESNIAYVINSRTKNTLIFADSRHLQPPSAGAVRHERNVAATTQHPPPQAWREEDERELGRPGNLLG